MASPLPAHSQAAPARAGLGGKLTDLLSDAAVYGLSSMLGQVAGFLLLPLYTEYLDPRQYGVIGMLAVVTMLFGPMANLGMTNAIFRRFNQCTDDTARRAVLGTGLTSVIGSSLALLVLSVFAAGPIAEFVVGDASTTNLVRLSLLGAAFAAVGAVPRIILRAARKARIGAALNLANVVFAILPTIWFVVIQGEGVRGVVLGTLTGEVISGTLAFVATWGMFDLGIDRDSWRQMLAYGLPFVPHHVQAVGLALFGQYMVREMLGLSEAGLYNMATRFAVPVSFVVSAVQTSWVAYKFQVSAQDENPQSFFRSTFTYYVAGMSYLWVGVCLWGPEMVRLMTTDGFHDAAYLVWAVSLIPLAQGMYFMLGTGIELGDRTGQYPLVSLAGLITVVVGAFALVGSLGALGAALATALGWLVMAGVIYNLSQRRFAIAYDWATIAGLVVAAAVCSAIAYVDQSAPLAGRLLIAVGLSLMYPLLVFLLLTRSQVERQRVLHVWHNSRRLHAPRLLASSLRRLARSTYRLVLGGGEPALARRQEYHRRRRVAEEAVLRDATTRSEMFHAVSCPACDRSEVSDTFRNPVGFSFSVCAHDGTVYMNPAPSLETLTRLYNDESYSNYWSVGHTADPADYARVERAIPPSPGQSLLDVGCSTGEFLKLARQRFDVHGVEINADTAALARESGFDVITGTLVDVPGSERFDVVTMLQVIEHLVEPSESLAEIHRLLKRGGVFYLNTPCVDSASFELFRERHMHVSSFGHVSLFTKAGMDALARRCGFAMIDHGRCGGIDISLDDLVSYKFARERFRHRVALYSPRLLNGCALVDQLTLGRLTAAWRPRGNESYQWAVLQKP